MKILNPQIQKDLDAGKKLKLNLGAGQKPRDGFYSVDHLALDGVDILADLNEPLDLLGDNSVEYIYSRHVLEHVTNLLPLMRELHRVVTPTGTIEIIVPHFSNVYAYSDPTHVRFFGLYTMYYFVAPENQPSFRKLPAFYTDTTFRLSSVKIEFYKSGLLDRILRPLVTPLVNLTGRTQDFYERRLCHCFHAHQLKYIMHPEK